MLRTSLLVSAVAVVAVLLTAGAGGVAAQETTPTSETVETASVAQQQQLVEAEITVKDRSENPLSGIRVTAEWGDDQSTSKTTTSAGRVLLDVPVNTDVAFSVNDSEGDFVRNLQPVEVSSDEVDEPITIRMAPRGQITFSVVDTNGDPVQDTRLRLTHEDSARTVDRVFTAEDGTATVSEIEQRTYDVNIRRAGYNTAELTVEVTGQQQSEEIEIQSNRVNVDFTVLDDHFEEPRPLEGAIVDVEGIGTPIPTDENGETQAKIPVNSRYEVTVDLAGYQDRTATLVVSEEPTSIQLRTQRIRSININQLQNAIVVGQPTQVTITNAYDEPVEDTRLSLNDETVGQTDARGQIVFNITQAGTNVIDASDDGLTASTTLEGVDPDQSDCNCDVNDSQPDTEEMENSADGDSENGDAIGPGFGLLAALGAILSVGLIAARRS